MSPAGQGLGSEGNPFSGTVSLLVYGAALVYDSAFAETSSHIIPQPQFGGFEYA